MIKSFLVFVLIAFSFVIVESAILSNIMLLPAVPDFLLLISLYVSFYNGKLYGAGSGFISGFFLDFLTVSPFGLNCLLRTLIGYTAGCFNKILNINGILIPVFLGFCATLVKAFFLWLISIFFPGSVNSYNLLSVQFGFELAANALLTPLVFRFLSIFGAMLLLEPGEIA